MHYYYTSGIQFLLEQSQQNKDWPSYLRMLPLVTNELLMKTMKNSTKSAVKSSCPLMTSPPTKIADHIGSGNSGLSSHSTSQQPKFLYSLDENISSDNLLMANVHQQMNNSKEEHLWQLWRWKPPVQSSLQTRDDYFHNPASTPHSIMNEFKKHLTMAKDMKFRLGDLRRLAEIEFKPLMSFVMQDDYDDHTDSIVRSYFIFKEGVMPLWEDEHNVFGGCWSLIWNQNHYHQMINEEYNPKKTSKYVWKQVINVLTDARMLKYIDEICGVGLTIRSNRTYKITVWNRNSYDTITKMMIGANMKTILNHEGPMFYYSHKSQLKNQYEKKKFDKVRRRVFQQNLNQRNLTHFNNNNQNVSTYNDYDDDSDDDSPKLNPNRSSGFTHQPNQDVRRSRSQSFSSSSLIHTNLQPHIHENRNINHNSNNHSYAYQRNFFKNHPNHLNSKSPFVW